MTSDVLGGGPPMGTDPAAEAALATVAGRPAGALLWTLSKPSGE